MKTIWGVLALVVLAGGVAAVATGPTAAQEDKAKNLPDLAKKVVYIRTEKISVTMKNVVVERLGDRPFLVGTPIEDGRLVKNAFIGSLRYIPVSDVQDMAVADTLEKLLVAD